MRRFFVMQKFWRRILSVVLEALFPAYCVGCGQEGGVLCVKCAQLLCWQKIELCPLCRRVSSGGRVCDRCKPSSLSGVVSGFIYDEGGLVGKLIKSYKYDYQYEAGVSLGRLVCQQVQSMGDFFSQFECVVPIPLHRRRYAERGFNQAEYFAEQIVSVSASGCVVNCLRRVKNTPRQAGLGREERLQNLAQAFVCNGDVRDKRVLLVDDVLTTGTTIVEAARVLCIAGAREVWGYTVARG